MVQQVLMSACGAGRWAELPRELLRLLLSNKEVMFMMEALRFPDNLPMKDDLGLLVFSTRVAAVPVEDEVFLFFGDFPFASVATSDPRLAFIKHISKNPMFDEFDDESMCKEQSEMDLSCYADLLGIPVDADANTIKKAFRKQSMQCHPDKAESNGLTVEEAEEKFKALSEAKTVLLTLCEGK